MNSINRNARIAGVLYLVIAVLAIFIHFYVPAELFVPGDATTTANNILASEGLLRMSIGSELVLLLSEIALSVILYQLLRPVNKTLSLVAAVSRVTMTIIHAVNLLNQFFILLLLSGAGYLSMFEPNQVHALVMLFLDAYSYGFDIGIVFLALHAFLLGYLIFKSGYLPKVLGILFMLAAFGYLIDSFSLILLTNYETTPTFIAIIIGVAEVAFPLWLLIKGVNVKQWERRALETSEALHPANGLA